MRLVEFLIQLLEAHAETLRRLAALLGEENLLALLEQDEEAAPSADASAAPVEAPPETRVEWLAPSPGSSSSPYLELESAVHDFGLPAVLEFHLWAYPHYRAFIESPLDLNSRIPGPGGDAGAALVEEAVAQAQAWTKRLPIGPGIAAQAERAAHVPWLRFRTTVLKRVGRRPLGPVY